MFRLTLFLLGLSLLPFSLASASSQYHLNTHTQASSKCIPTRSRRASLEVDADPQLDRVACWVTCHEEVTETITLPGWDTNDPVYVTKNCQFDVSVTDLFSLSPLRARHASFTWSSAVPLFPRPHTRRGIILHYISLLPQWHDLAYLLSPQQYLNLMSLCLVQTCRSAPDAAYAVEYGTSFCKRAGVAVNITLPAGYLAAASDYFTWVKSHLPPQTIHVVDMGQVRGLHFDGYEDESGQSVGWDRDCGSAGLYLLLGIIALSLLPCILVDMTYADLTI